MEDFTESTDIIRDSPVLPCDSSKIPWTITPDTV